jgi:threonine dehydratase
MTLPTTLPDRASVAAAQERIAADIRHTPLWRLPARALGLNLDAELWLKLEHLQRSGSFKARGMFNRLRAQPVPAAGVVIASGGNAGIAAATAAQALGHRCEVFVPEVSSAAKRAAAARLGATVVVGGATYGDALAASLARQRESGALLLHAYDQGEVVAGAGTLAFEVEQDAGAPDRVLVSVGGGGLLGGLLAHWGGRGVAVDALEPAAAPTLNAALAAGAPVDVPVGGVAADSLGARRLGSIAWGLVQRHGVTSHLLADDAIRAAQQTLWAELRLAVEPAAALPWAALANGAVRPRAGERVLLVICGANVDPATVG